MKHRQLVLMAGVCMLALPALAQEQSPAASESTLHPETGQTKAVRSSLVQNSDQPYKAALGIKFLWGISATGKFFLKDKAALEAIVHYDGMGGLGTALNLTALYEYHGNFAVPGLRWYLGGGASLGYAKLKGFEDSELDSSTFSYGIDGVAGLEYKIDKLPIAVSLDWQPGYSLNSGGGFISKSGGFGVKYTF